MNVLKITIQTKALMRNHNRHNNSDPFSINYLIIVYNLRFKENIAITFEYIPCINGYKPNQRITDSFKPY